MRAGESVMTCQPDVNWNGYLRDLPQELADSIREYVTHCSHTFREENRIQQTRSLLSALSGFPRSMHLPCIQNITPRVWFTHVEARMKAGVNPSSLNTTLRIIQSFLSHLKGNGIPICETMLEVRPLKIGQPLPRDLTASQVKVLLQVVSSPMDRAWIILMLHCGLRTCEVRSLHWSDVDLHAQTIRIHESKGLQSRVVFLGPQTIQVLNCLSRDSEYVFTHHNQPLSRRYCQSRLTTIGNQCGIHISPHQLRHTCATMLLNAGMSILGVQRILGHKYVETTLKYARVYDSTVVKDFQWASSRR
jgi:site-specific recombinase XerD